MLVQATAIGDTFGIVQGYTDASTVSFEIWHNEEYLGRSDVIKTQNNAFALTITIPENYNQVIIIPIYDGILQSQSYTLSSGQTLLVESDSKSKSIQEVDIKDEKTSEVGDIIASGNQDLLPDEIQIIPIPQVDTTKPPVKGFQIKQLSVSPDVEFPEPLASWRSFVTNPITILSVLIAYLLAITALIRKRTR